MSKRSIIASPLTHLISSLIKSFSSSNSTRSRYYFAFAFSVIGVSYFLFFYLQYSIENDTRDRLIEEQITDQMKSTERVSIHMTSDLVSILAIMNGLANSQYLQQGVLGSEEKTKDLVHETFSQINSYSIVDRLFVLNTSDVVTIYMAPDDDSSPFFGSQEVSFEELV